MNKDSPLRRVAPVLLAAVLGAVIAFVATAGQPTAAAEARVRLHDNVNWPEHDAVRLEIQSWLDAETFNAADDAVGGALRGLDAELPRNQSFLNVVATADDDESAVTGLNVAIDQLVQRDEAFTLEPFRVSLASAQEGLAAAQTRLADVTPAAESGDQNAINERGALTWRVEELGAKVQDAERDLASQTPRIYQIGETRTSDAQRFRRLRIIAASGLVAGLAAAAAMTVLGGRLTRGRAPALSN